MQKALAQAEDAYKAGEVPVGAVIVDAGGNILAVARNTMERRHNPLAHAEMLVIQEVCEQYGMHRLEDCDLYVTLEPCPMCAQAVSFARLRRLYFGAYDPKGGGVENGPRLFEQSTCHHAPEVYGGIMETEAKALLQRFFKELREEKR